MFDLGDSDCTRIKVWSGFGGGNVASALGLSKVLPDATSTAWAKRARRWGDISGVGR